MNTLGMFARFPEAGRTKTRLAASIGDQQAADLYACFVEDLIGRTCKLADQQWIAFTPDDRSSRRWFESMRETHGGSRCSLMVQPDGSLGERIAWFFRQAARQNGGAVVLIGTDSPDLPASRIDEAFELLNAGSADMVIAPAADGGYVLIGMNGEPENLFGAVRWSSPYTLLDTMVAAEKAGRNLSMLPGWYDIDHVENLGTLIALQQNPGLTGAAPCPRTAACLMKVLIDQVNG